MYISGGEELLFIYNHIQKPEGYFEPKKVFFKAKIDILMLTLFPLGRDDFLSTWQSLDLMKTG